MGKNTFTFHSVPHCTLWIFFISFIIKTFKNKKKVRYMTIQKFEHSHSKKMPQSLKINNGLGGKE